jgi:hypothetical protein
MIPKVSYITKVMQVYWNIDDSFQFTPSSRENYTITKQVTTRFLLIAK